MAQTDAERIQAIRERWVHDGGPVTQTTKDIRTLLALLEEAVGLLEGMARSPGLAEILKTRAFVLRYKGENR